ncbi:MAG: LysM peptidoglycan-binding domain-containing protein [Candidatus Omnitrophica bacterium]|jgi:phage tail protein X|nr:LysM peptidoglycan-binding domain-containing protein [Candidatus Omnitrophota bacterium]
MKNKNVFGFLTLASVLILSGCVARTYSMTKDRVDQSLESGNRGYLTGKAPAQSAAERKDNREIRVFEFELGRSYKTKKSVAAPAASASEVVVMQESFVSEPLPEASLTSQKYVVGKNDTLQKISKKFYGTTKKWTKIYEANKDVLKGPDKVYPGQTLNIPDAAEMKPAAETLSEPKENLK